MRLRRPAHFEQPKSSIAKARLVVNIPDDSLNTKPRFSLAF